MRIRISKYLKSSGSAIEAIDGRVRIGFIECPKCRTAFGIFRDQFDDEGISKTALFHSCGFNEPVFLEEWDEVEANNRWVKR